LLDLPESAWFDVGMMRKAIRLAQDVGRDEHVPLPWAIAVDDVLGKASELGYAGHDIASLHEVLARLAGPEAAARA
jgi:3-hydroxyisobutyrate dehydrogenase